MGDRHRNSPAYLYIQHPHFIHLAERQTKQRSVIVQPRPAPLTLWTPPYTPPLLHIPSNPLHAPPYLLLHPFLQLARIDELHPAASHTPCPAVIVSPHSTSPPPTRDSTRPVSKKPPTKPAQPPKGAADGNKETQHSVPTSAPTMTPSGLPVPIMASKREEAATQARNQRPVIVSQHSSSVPSTPLQAARRYETRSRSPSPNGGLGSHSPRSVSSEANSTMPTLRPRGPYKCKFETNVGSLGRRRMPYQSSDILDKAKEEPKKTLDPHEDDKLSGDMRELYDRLLPNPDNTKLRQKLVDKVQHILETEFPGNQFEVAIFGSSGNMLWTAESDVDICIKTPMRKLEEMHMLAEALDKHGMERVVCISGAKVRIVKVWDPELQLSCDLNVNNAAALENTRMIMTYVNIDKRVRPLAMIIKHWTKRRMLNDAGIGGTISSYTWICMILNFLQTQDPPILPCLHQLPNRETDKETGKPSLSSFADDIGELRGFGEKNTETLGQLLFQFFRLYGHEVDYEEVVISVRHGNRMKREEKKWHIKSGTKEGSNRLCVEEPFSTDRNLGNSADDYAWHGIHLEIRRAFDLLADNQQLERACEQYEFPAVEQSSSIFKKPQSQKAILTSSVPIRNGRGGSNHRGGRGGFSSRNNNPTGRRASGSNSYIQGRPPFPHSPPISAGPGHEYCTVPGGLHEQLHDQLAQQYQLLEMQSNSLRARLAAQQHAHQAHQVRAAQMHAHAVAQAQGRAPNGVNGSPQKSPYVNGRSSPRLAELGIPPGALPPGFFYHYPGYYNQLPQPDTASTDGSRTNPSSPSLSNSTLGLRRQVHRQSNASDTGGLRSQSQPPHGVAQQPIPVIYQAMPQFIDPTSIDPATAGGYPIARSTPHATPNLQSTPITKYSPPSIPIRPAASEIPIAPSEPSAPKEYVGYTFQPQDYVVGPIPSFSELAQRRRRVSPEVTQPLLKTASRRVSRSPSPLGGHMRSNTTSAAQYNVPGIEKDKARDSGRPAMTDGPVIVNGSRPPPREPRMRSDAVDALPPSMSTAPGLGIFANAQTMQQVTELHVRQQLVLEEMQRQKAAAELQAPTVVNGSSKSSPHVEANGSAQIPNQGQHAFPALPEGWMKHASSNGKQTNHSEEVSPKRALPPQWRTAAYANDLPSLDTSNVPRVHPLEVQSATMPLLSPVFETRTPSPTASRSHQSGKPVNGVNGVKVHDKNNGQQQHRGSHTSPTNESKENRNGLQKGKAHGNENGSKSAGPNGSGTWQQSSNRNRKNKSQKKKAVDQRTIGEPLPANAADRKGG